MKPIRFNKSSLREILRIYLDNRPAFLSVIRAKEAALFNAQYPFRSPSLDFGCGDGFFTKVSLLGKSQKIDIGLETDQKRAKQARKSLIYNKVVLYKGLKIPIAGSTVSTVISNSVMEHIPNVEISLKEIFRILKKNGVFYVSVMESGYENNLFGTLFLGWIYKAWMRKRAYHANMFTTQEWEGIFRDIGFKIEGKLGYLNKKSTRLLDILQYLSIPSIITQNRFTVIGKGYCKLMRLSFENLIVKTILEEGSLGGSSYFYILKK